MTQATRVCPYCSAPLDTPRRVQCGAPDCKRQHRNAQQRTFQRKYKAEHGSYYSRKYDQPRQKQYPVTCARCGVEAVVTKNTAKYCSHRCWYDAKHAAHAQVELWRPKPADPKAQPVTILKPLRPRWYSGKCPLCADWFVTFDPRTQYCSQRCARRADKDKRRALEREAFVAHVDRTQVYERDGWTCQLCRNPVARDEVVPHPKAPTLDHVVPLSRGGTHEPANVQLAHYWCNTIKADGEWNDDEQMLLLD